MKTKIIFKTILFIFLSSLLLISSTGFTKAEEIKNTSDLEIDTSYDITLSSINKILERTEDFNKADLIIKNIKFDSYSYTLNIFCEENNDRQILNARNKRLAELKARFGSLDS